MSKRIIGATLFCLFVATSSAQESGKPEIFCDSDSTVRGGISCVVYGITDQHRVLWQTYIVPFHPDNKPMYTVEDIAPAILLGDFNNERRRDIWTLVVMTTYLGTLDNPRNLVQSKLWAIKPTPNSAPQYAKYIPGTRWPGDTPK